jgi:hypothetical protein
MSNSHYQDVLDFHEKFQVPLAPKHTLLEGEALKFRLDFLQEELNELKEKMSFFINSIENQRAAITNDFDFLSL